MYSKIPENQKKITNGKLLISVLCFPQSPHDPASRNAFSDMCFVSPKSPISIGGKVRRKNSRVSGKNVNDESPPDADPAEFDRRDEAELPTPP